MPKQKPIIGILADKEAKENIPRYFVKRNYISAIKDAGGLPFLIPPAKDNDDLVKLFEIINGLLIPGGDDIDSKYFNEALHPSVVLTDPEIIQFQMDFCKEALNRDIPILGICAGHQIINISCGGNIYQDIPSQYKTSIKHKKIKDEKNDASHSVNIERDSKLYNILQTEEILVNSTHHQALKDVAEGFVVTAKSKDGIIEAVESVNHQFVLGVQWHPEDMYSDNKVFLNLFEKLIDEARPRPRAAAK